MEIQENIVNKVAASGLVTLNLEQFYDQGEKVIFDIKDNLFHGLMLREKDFREFIKTHDAIVPTWAYMLLANKIKPYASALVFGNKEVLNTVLFTKALAKIDLSQYQDARVVIKGCGELDVPVSAYVEITSLLTPVVKSIMYGEPCSTVPVYKRKD
jgi:flagellar basal body P-ring protein FlgI